MNRLRAETLPRFAPEQVAAITGVSADTIEHLAREYGRARAPFIRLGMGATVAQQQRRYGGTP
ncbi:MAG: hypothetical protein U0531_20570 [Dehalococcoidia bacterium]